MKIFYISAIVLALASTTEAKKVHHKKKLAKHTVGDDITAKKQDNKILQQEPAVPATETKKNEEK